MDIIPSETLVAKGRLLKDSAKLGIILDMLWQSLAVAALLPFQKAAMDAVDVRIAKADPAVSLCRFVGYPKGGSDDRFVPNPAFWGKGIDFSCASPWNSGGGSLRAGTLISKRHVLFAKHFPLWKGVRILFVDDEGVVCPCYVDATKGVDASDMMVGLLNAEVTPNIHPAKVLPDDFAQYLGDGYGLPVVTLNRQEKAFVTELNVIPTNGTPPSVRNREPKDARRALFRDRIVIGDSGNPAFLVIGNTPILLYCLQTGGCGCGPFVNQHRRELQAAMDELCPGYKLETFDFSVDSAKVADSAKTQ